MGDSFVEMSFSQLNNMADRGNTVRRCGFVRRTTFASEKKSVPNPINDAKLLGLQLGSLDEEDEEEKELDDQTMMEFETGFVVNFNVVLRCLIIFVILDYLLQTLTTSLRL